MKIKMKVELRVSPFIWNLQRVVRQDLKLLFQRASKKSWLIS